MTVNRKIVLKKGAPPLAQLHMEVRTRSKIPFDMSSYSYAFKTERDGSRVEGTFIGQDVEDILDAINEERLLHQNGEGGIDEFIGLYSRYIVEIGDVSGRAAKAPGGEYEILFFEFCLCDEEGTVWTQMVEVQDGPLVDAEDEEQSE